MRVPLCAAETFLTSIEEIPSVTTYSMPPMLDVLALYVP